MEWSWIGLGLGALLITSPTVRKGARNLVVSALAGGMRVAQGISNFGGQIREEMTGAMNGNGGNGQQPPQPQTEPLALPAGPAPN